MNKIILILSVLLFGGCSSSMIRTNTSLPLVQNSQENKKVDVTLFELDNYTDTPRAGLRAANIIEGILLAKGYTVTKHFSKSVESHAKAKEIAHKNGSAYFIVGGVSEWRYKTGIDGEPAVSIQSSMYETSSDKLVWSATGADSDWGNGSIGTTAQNLLEKMMKN